MQITVCLGCRLKVEIKFRVIWFEENRVVIIFFIISQVMLYSCHKFPINKTSQQRNFYQSITSRDYVLTLKPIKKIVKNDPPIKFIFHTYVIKSIFRFILERIAHTHNFTIAYRVLITWCYSDWNFFLAIWVFNQHFDIKKEFESENSATCLYGMLYRK